MPHIVANECFDQPTPCGHAVLAKPGVPFLASLVAFCQKCAITVELIYLKAKPCKGNALLYLEITRFLVGDATHAVTVFDVAGKLTVRRLLLYKEADVAFGYEKLGGIHLC